MRVKELIRRLSEMPREADVLITYHDSEHGPLLATVDDSAFDVNWDAEHGINNIVIDTFPETE